MEVSRLADKIAEQFVAIRPKISRLAKLAGGTTVNSVIECRLNYGQDLDNREIEILRHHLQNNIGQGSQVRLFGKKTIADGGFPISYKFAASGFDQGLLQQFLLEINGTQ